jgi:hypothetical protein
MIFLLALITIAASAALVAGQDPVTGAIRVVIAHWVGWCVGQVVGTLMFILLAYFTWCAVSAVL